MGNHLRKKQLNIVKNNKREIVDYKNDPIVNFYIKKELNLLKIASSLVMYTFICIGFSFYLFNFFQPNKEGDQQFIKRLGSMEKSMHSYFEKQSSFQDGQRAYLDQKLDLIKDSKKGVAKEDFQEIKDKYLRLKEMKLEKWRSLIDRDMNYSWKNVRVLQKAQQIKLNDLKFDLAQKESELAEALDLSRSSDQEIFRSFKKKSEILIFELKKEHQQEVLQFKKQGFYTKRSS